MPNPQNEVLIFSQILKLDSTYNTNHKIKYCGHGDFYIPDSKFRGFSRMKPPNNHCLKFPQKTDTPSLKKQYNICKDLCTKYEGCKAANFELTPDSNQCCLRKKASSMSVYSKNDKNSCFTKTNYKKTIAYSGNNHYPFHSKDVAEKACKNLGYKGLCNKNDIISSNTGKNVCLDGWTNDSNVAFNNDKLSFKECGPKGWNERGITNGGAHCCGIRDSLKDGDGPYTIETETRNDPDNDPGNDYVDNPNLYVFNSISDSDLQSKRDSLNQYKGEYTWRQKNGTGNRWWFKIKYYLKHDVIVFIWWQNWWINSKPPTNPTKDKDYGFLPNNLPELQNKYTGLENRDFNQSEYLTIDNKFQGLYNYKKTSGQGMFVGQNNLSWFWTIGMSDTASKDNYWKNTIPIPNTGSGEGAYRVDLSIYKPLFWHGNSMDITGTWNKSEDSNTVLTQFNITPASYMFRDKIAFNLYEVDQNSTNFFYEWVNYIILTKNNKWWLADYSNNYKAEINEKDDEIIFPLENIVWHKISVAFENERKKLKWQEYPDKAWKESSSSETLFYDSKYCDERNMWDNKQYCGMNSNNMDKNKQKCQEWDKCRGISCDKTTNICHAFGVKYGDPSVMLSNLKKKVPLEDNSKYCTFTLEEHPKPVKSSHKVENMTFQIKNITGGTVSSCKPYGNNNCSTDGFNIKKNCITTKGYSCPESTGWCIPNGNPTEGFIENHKLTDNFKISTNPQIYDTYNPNLCFDSGKMINNNTCNVNGYKIEFDNNSISNASVCKKLGENAVVPSKIYNYLKKYDSSDGLLSWKSTFNNYKSVPLKCSKRNSDANSCQVLNPFKILTGTSPTTPCLSHPTTDGLKCLNIANIFKDVLYNFNDIRNASNSGFDLDVSKFKKVLKDVMGNKSDKKKSKNSWKKNIDNVNLSPNISGGSNEDNKDFDKIFNIHSKNITGNVIKDIVESFVSSDRSDFEHHKSGHHHKSRHHHSSISNPSWHHSTTVVPPIKNLRELNPLFLETSQSHIPNQCKGEQYLETSKKTPFSLNEDPCILILIDPNNPNVTEVLLKDMALQASWLSEIEQVNTHFKNLQQDNNKDEIYEKIMNVCSFYVKINSYKIKLPDYIRDYIEKYEDTSYHLNITEFPVLKKWFSSSNNRISFSSGKFYIINSLIVKKLKNDDDNIVTLQPPFNFMYNYFSKTSFNIPPSNYIPLECFFAINIFSANGKNKIENSHLTTKQNKIINKLKNKPNTNLITNKTTEHFKNWRSDKDNVEVEDIGVYELDLKKKNKKDNIDVEEIGVYELDLKKDLTPLEKSKIEFNFSHKARYYKDFSDKNIMVYNNKTDINNRKINELSSRIASVNNLVRTSDDLTKRIEDKTKNIELKKRNYDIVVNNTKSQDNKNFLLRTLLTYVLVIAVPFILKTMYPKSKVFKYMKYILIVITIPFFLLTILNIYSFRNRSNIRHTLRDWKINNKNPVTHPFTPAQKQCLEEAEILNQELKEEVMEDIAEINSEIVNTEMLINNSKKTIIEQEQKIDTLEEELCYIKKNIGEECKPNLLESIKNNFDSITSSFNLTRLKDDFTSLKKDLPSFTTSEES